MITRVIWKITFFVYKLLSPKKAWEFAMSPPVQFIFKLIIKLFGDHSINIKTKYGFNMILTVEEYLVGGYLHLGETNPFETNIMRKLLANGDVFFDVGAYKGWYAMNAAQIVGKNGNVFAFEANKEVARILGSIQKLNGFNNIQVETVAVSDKNGTNKFWTGNKDMLGSLIKKHIQTYSDTPVNSIEIKTITLDSFNKNKKLKKINMIKIDVEGSDLDVLKGAGNILRKYSPYLLVEVFGLSADINKNRKNEILDYLSGFGYKPYQFVANGLKEFDSTQQDAQLINLFFAKTDRELRALGLLV